MGVIRASPSQMHGRGINLVIISILFVFTATCLVVSRIISRHVTGRGLGHDDFAITLAWLFAVALTICNCVSVAHGYGKGAESLPRDNVTATLQAFWVMQIMYKLTINCTKVSICLLYLRIFRTSQQFRPFCYAVLSFVFTYAIVSIIITIFQCTPVDRAWDKSIHGACISLTAFWFAGAVLNVVGDFLILLLPMPMIKTLHMPVRQKWGVGMMFALGAFVCVTSVLRMTTLEKSSKSADPTWGTLNSTIWTTIEADTGIICACLPSLKAPLTKIFPKLFPRGSYEDYSNGSSGPRGAFRRASTAKNLPPSAYDGWGRPKESMNTDKRTPTVTSDSIELGKPASGNGSKGTSSDGTYGMDSKDVPMGHISKTTHVNVQYGDELCYPINHTTSASGLVKPQTSFP